MQQVKLSPLNMHGFIAAQRGLYFEYVPPVLTKARPFAKRVSAYECPDCGDLHRYEMDAEECCEASMREPLTAHGPEMNCKCPVCATPAFDNFDASDCCLWKDLDQPTRWKMAEAVDAGSTWAEQLQIDVK